MPKVFSAQGGKIGGFRAYATFTLHLSPPGPSLLVAEGRLNTKGRAVASRSKTARGLVTAPIFLLVPQVKLPRRLDLARDAQRAHDAVPGLIVAKWVEGRTG